MNSRQLLTAIAVILLLASQAVTADAMTCRGSGNADCFVLRAPVALIPAVSHAYGLTVLRSLDPNDADLVLVAGPENVPAETTETLVSEDADVTGFERVTTAALTEGADSQADGTTAILEGLDLAGEFTGPEGQHFTTSLWNGYFDQPALDVINLDAAHALSHPEALGEGAVVAIIDTGVDPFHPLLQEALIPGYDFILDQPGIPSEWDALDPAQAATTRSNFEYVADQSYGGIVEGNGGTVFKNPATAVIVEQSYGGIVEGETVPSAFGHGTMVAGIVRLVAPAAKIMPLRAFGGEGTGDLGDILEAIYFAIDNGATVINMSFSAESHSEELARAIKEAKKRKVLAVSSAGNTGVESLTYPAAYGETFGVASVSNANQLSGFSNFGYDLVTVAAPGEGVITSYPGGLLAGSWGTSFSAAFVSGTLATLHDIADNGSILRINLNQAADSLESSAVQPDPQSPSDAWGAGILDVHGAFGLGRQGY